jgi:hypothetical protein
MPMSRWSAALSVVAAVVVSGPVSAQQPAKPSNPGEERFRPYRLEAKPANDAQTKLNAMKTGTVNLDPPIPKADQQVLDEMARQYVYPVTHHENYFQPESRDGTMVPKSTETASPLRVMNNLRAQCNFFQPGEKPPLTQLAYVREFGASAVKAIDEVLAKGPPSVIRVNALRALEIVAETGAPAAWDAVIKLLKTKDEPNHPVETLYYSLKAAEKALASYDRDRPKWVSKKQYFDLVSVVEDVVVKTPACVIEKTYIPDRPFTTATLQTDPKAPKPAAALTPEQADVVRAFRLQAVRALAKVRTDIVPDENGENERRPLHTLAKVVVGDASLTPAPDFKEVGEATMGLTTLLPSDSVNPNALGLVIAWGVGVFAQEKVASAKALSKDAIQRTHWKVYGARMKATFAAWEKDLQTPRVKLPKADKDGLVALSQLCVTAVFDPLTRQTESGQVNLDTQAINNWYGEKGKAFTGWPIDLYTDKPTYKLNPANAR